MSVQEIRVLSKINRYKNTIRASRIKPKILLRHKKIIQQISIAKENKKIPEEISNIQLELFSENLN